MTFTKELYKFVQDNSAMIDKLLLYIDEEGAEIFNYLAFYNLEFEVIPYPLSNIGEILIHKILFPRFCSDEMKNIYYREFKLNLIYQGYTQHIDKKGVKRINGRTKTKLK